VISPIFGNDLDQIFNLGPLFLRKSRLYSIYCEMKKMQIIFQ